MYTNIFYFIVVLSIFSFYVPQKSSTLSLEGVFLYVIIIFLFFFVFTKVIFARFHKKYFCGKETDKSFSTLHTRLINKSIVFAIALYAVIIYVCDAKFFLLRIPLLNRSELALNSIGLIIFSAFLVIIWRSAFKSYQTFYDSSASLGRYLISHLRLNISIIVPWLVLSFALDIAKLLPPWIVVYIKDNSFLSYFLFASFLILIACFSPYLMVNIWNCKPLPQGSFKRRLEEFCKRAGFKYSDILFWNLFDGKLISAGVIGLVKQFRYLLLSPALLDILNEDEIEAVVAHEIGHIKNRHMIFYILFVLGYVVFAYAFINIMFYGLLSQDVLFRLFVDNKGSLRDVFYVLPIIILIVFLFLYFRFLFGMFSRNFERQSDLYSIKVLGDGSGIINSLEKIAYAANHNRNTPNWHHFSILERVNFLKKCEQNPELVKKHDKKVNRLIAFYIIALILIGGFFYGIKSTILSQSELNLAQKIVEKKVEADPANPSFHFTLANIYFEKKNFLKAEKEYLITLDISPISPEALNNLAWLYATAEDENFRKPYDALKYSLLATKISSQPHILDTLAESYFINGYYFEAIEVIKLAISKNPANTAYYEKQLNKFEKYLNWTEA